MSESREPEYVLAFIAQDDGKMIPFEGLGTIPLPGQWEDIKNRVDRFYDRPILGEIHAYNSEITGGLK